MSKLDTANLSNRLKSSWKVLSGYLVSIFLLAVLVLYGFIVWRIDVYRNVPADPNEEKVQTAALPHIDQSVVDKINSLQDNSENVQTLFNAARNNPFNE